MMVIIRCELWRSLIPKENILLLASWVSKFNPMWNRHTILCMCIFNVIIHVSVPMCGKTTNTTTTHIHWMGCFTKYPRWSYKRIQQSWWSELIFVKTWRGLDEEESTPFLKRITMQISYIYAHYLENVLFHQKNNDQGCN